MTKPMFNESPKHRDHYYGVEQVPTQTSLIILNTIPPHDATELEWLVQWSAGGITHEKRFQYFSEVSAFVEGTLLSDEYKEVESDD